VLASFNLGPFDSLRSLRAFASTDGPAMGEARRAESNGGEGRIRTSEAARATDLQSGAFDRFATSPFVSSQLAVKRAGFARQAESAVRSTATLHANCLDLTVYDVPCGTARNPLSVLKVELAKGFEPPTG
jgi:hypothetical protein